MHRESKIKLLLPHDNPSSDESTNVLCNQKDEVIETEGTIYLASSPCRVDTGLTSKQMVASRVLRPEARMLTLPELRLYQMPASEQLRIACDNPLHRLWWKGRTKEVVS